MTANTDKAVQQAASPTRTTTAATKVFGMPEILEQILLDLPWATAEKESITIALTGQQLSPAWLGLLQGSSPALQRKVGLLSTGPKSRVNQSPPHAARIAKSDRDQRIRREPARGRRPLNSALLNEVFHLNYSSPSDRPHGFEHPYNADITVRPGTHSFRRLARVKSASWRGMFLTKTAYSRHRIFVRRTVPSAKDSSGKDKRVVSRGELYLAGDSITLEGWLTADEGVTMGMMIDKAVEMHRKDGSIEKICFVGPRVDIIL